MAKKSKNQEVTEIQNTVVEQFEPTTITEAPTTPVDMDELTLAQTVAVQAQPGAEQVLTGDEVRVYAKLQAKLCESMATPCEMQLGTLRTLSKAFGLVISRRGPGGGHFPTDKGLEFIGIDVAAFRAAEAYASEKAKEAEKARVKARNAARKQQASAALASAALMLKAS